MTVKEALPKEVPNEKFRRHAGILKEAKDRTPIKGIDYDILPDLIPLSTPLERLYQLLGVALWFSHLVFVLIGPTIISLYLLIFQAWSRPFLLAYVAWMIYDKDSATTGRQPNNHLSSNVRLNPVWDYFSSYFPAQLVRTHALDPSKKYVFGFNPHGVCIRFLI